MMTIRLCTLVSGLALALTAAQPSSLPQAYGFQATSRVFGQMELKVNRNVSKEIIEITGRSYHIRVLYDFQAHRIYTTDLNTNSCTTQEYTSSYAPTAHDPIGGLEEMKKQGGPPPTMRDETVNGIAAKVAENNGQKIWLEAQYGYGFPVKIEVQGQTAFEMRNLVYGRSAPHLFTTPSGCTAVAGTTNANGGHAEFSAGTGTGARKAGGPSSSSASGNPAVKADDKALLGEWTFTGQDAKGTVWNGTFKVSPLGEYSSNSGEFSNMCSVTARSGNTGKGISAGCQYNALNKTLTWSNDDFSLTAVLSPDGKSLTQGKWLEKGAAGSWSAKR
jgi:hypothetical protein